MKKEIALPRTVDEYVKAFDPEVRNTLEKLRETIRKAAPEAEELISYQMPAYKYKGILVYFGAYINHIGFYPTGRGIEAFKKELAAYEGSKGTVRFPLEKPLPFRLISKIVKFRVKEYENKKKAKK